MRNGIGRSDSSKTYNNIRTCLLDILAEYNDNLTQDVTITVINDILNVNNIGTFIIDIINFNLQSDYYLRINGNNLLTIDCRTLGGIKFSKCSNIVLDGINFR